ncbi:ferric reductase NAD binding domain-containing protein [Auriculariales sp. MPI-PUGE-AT-0066]|nr:ferric reductase NAD binding domain-containing protein [Auriculariales sp. MPI-PUGE-AT-0066]
MASHGPASPSSGAPGSVASGMSPSSGGRDPAAAARRKVRDALNEQSAEEVWFAVVAAFIFTLTFVRFVELLILWQRKRQISSRIKSLEESDSGALPNSPSPDRISLRRIPLAVTAAFRAVAFRTTIPVGLGSTVTIADGVTIALYYAAVLGWHFARTTFGAKGPQRFYWMDRAAFIGAAQIPLVVALAGKNNVISWLTGISHEKLNVIHRAAGRLIVLLFWLHGMGRVANGLAFVKFLSTSWMKAGVLSLVALTLTFIVSLRPIRKRFFEFFLITHIVTMILFIAGGYVHRPEVKYYFWPGFLVWGLDRGLRLARLFYLNIRTASPARVELAADHTVRLTVSRRMSWKAGQHAYIVVPSVSTFPFEAHPFTISSISASLGESALPSEKDLVFLVHGEDGFTKRLREYVTAKGVCSVPVYVDGPYGMPPSLETFDTVILVAGGTGITYTLPLLLDAVRNAKLGRSVVRKIVFIWAIRNAADVKWISSALVDALATAPARLAIEPRIFVTRGDASIPTLTSTEDRVFVGKVDDAEDKSAHEIVDEKEIEKSASESDAALSALRLELGRPDVDSLLRAEIAAARGQRVSIDVAGPSTLAAAVRSTLRSSAAGPSSALRGGASVTLHVETFSH